MSKKIVFDFDQTLTTFDTIYPFLLFCNKDNIFLKFLKKFAWYLCSILYRLKIVDNFTLKNCGVKIFFKNYDKKYIEKKEEEFIKKIKYFDEVFNKLKEHLHKGNKVYISSASFEEYLNSFSNLYSLPLTILASQLEFKDNKVKGIKFNNYGEKKADYFKKNNIEIDLLYTDSYSDKSLAYLAKKIIIIDKKGHIIEIDSYEKFVNYFRGSTSLA